MVNEPTFVLNTKNGGMNWGYCVKENESGIVEYDTTVKTSTIPNSGTK